MIPGLNSKTEGGTDGQKYREALHDFGIVIPVSGYSDLLPLALGSCLNQEGKHTLQLVVVDKSHDPRIAELVAQLTEHDRALESLEITYIQSDDSGPADAISVGLNLLNASIMTWLGSDDLLMPGSLASVASLFRQFPDVEWVTGVSFKIDEQGVFFSVPTGKSPLGFPTSFPQHAVARGLFASASNLPFIQQEGTFWSRDLWRRSGSSLSTELRAAFDFELWTRFAQHAELLQADVPLGAFRKRAGQLSGNRQLYFSEVQMVRTRLARQFRHRRMLFNDAGRIASRTAQHTWECKTIRYTFLAEGGFLGMFGLGVIRRKVLHLAERMHRRGILFRLLLSRARETQLGLRD